MVNPNSCTQYLGDKEILQDALMSQKHVSEGYNTFAGECASTELRDAFLNILNDEHGIQSDVFSILQTNGWYPTEAAPPQKVQAARQKFSAQP